MDFLDLEGAEDGLPRFLQLVGSTLTNLKLVLPDSMLLDIALVFRSCSDLQSLAIYGVVVDAVAFLRRYGEHGMRIKELCCRFTDVAVVTNELQDKDAALTRSLKSFEYSATLTRRPGGESELSAILSMLRSNRSLEHVRVRVPDDAYYLCIDAVEKYD